MDQAFYQEFYRFLTRQGYLPVRYKELLLFKKEDWEYVLLVRVIPETLPGQDPADVDREHDFLDRLVRDTMIVTGKRTEGLLLLVRRDNPDISSLNRIRTYPDVWTLNRVSGRLLIYENQKAEFFGLEKKIEDFMVRWEQQSRAEKKSRLARVFTPMNVALIGINILVFVFLSILGDTEDADFIARWGGMTYSLVADQHRYYLLLTAMFVHFGIEHIGENMLMLLLVGQTLERHLGKAGYLAVYLGSGLISSLTSLRYTLAANPNTVSGGASGAVFGVLGGLLFLILENALAGRKSLEGVSLRGIIFIILLGVSHGFMVTDVDNAAHIGGLAAGFVLTAVIELGRWAAQVNRGTIE